MKSTAASVDEYLEEIPAERKDALSELRGRLKRIAPDAEESMRYGMPIYSLDGFLFGIASQKQYMSLYVDAELLDTYRPRLGALNLGVGCIRFRHLRELPMDVVEDLMREAAERRRARQTV